MRPRIVCHMASSLDGRIIPSRWMPKGVHDHGIYEDLHERLGGGSWIVGRATGQEFAKVDVYPDVTTTAFAREAWLPIRDAEAYAFVVDAGGKIAWGRAEIDGDPIVVLLTSEVSDAHLAGLRGDGVGYLFAGRNGLDLAGAMFLVRQKLGVEHLLLEGGGGLNGSFLRAGLVDEISLMLEPTIDGVRGAPSTFDASDGGALNHLPIASLTLKSHEVLDNGILWLRYAVEAG